MVAASEAPDKPPRRNLSKRLRYEVLRRDNHACRYCGASAPDAKLTVDHVVPVALGGSDGPSNLVTACVDCNAGKSATSPNEQLTQEVAADALRWARAIRLVAEAFEANYQAGCADQDEFDEAWRAWSYGPERDRQEVPRDADWRSSVDTWLRMGMTVPLLEECIGIAMRSLVAPERKWRYFCGVAWSRLTEIQQAARLVVDKGQD